MELRCKRGDLAVVLQAVHPENIGRFVSVERELGYFKLGEVEYTRWGMLIPAVSGFYWLVTTPDAAPAMIGDGVTSCVGFIPDQFLQPIRDPGVDQATETEKTLEDQLC